VSASTVDSATGNLLIGGERVFPIGLSDPPPLGSTVTETGADAWDEIAAAGVTHVRNYTEWDAGSLDEQLQAVSDELDAATSYGLQLWLGLAGVATDLTNVALLQQIVDTFKDHPGLGVWKGADEPAHGQNPAEGCVAVYQELQALDPTHPVVIIEAPRGPTPIAGGDSDTPLTIEAVQAYAAACDIHGVDIYPVSIPPGLHAGQDGVNTDISVVGDMTTIIAQATQGNGIWTTLQIAWSGVEPPNPIVFPTLQQARFMAYDAIIAGARGLFFFGGHLTSVMNPADQENGWNWSYWQDVQRPLLVELTDADHTAVLTAPTAQLDISADADDIALSARETNGSLYVIAVRTDATATSPVGFAGLPATISDGVVLAHPFNPERSIQVADGAFADPDPYRPHNARVYRFGLP
jgi:hypothetical protein